MKKTSILNKSCLSASMLVVLAFASGQNAYAQDVYQQHDLVANVAGTADFTDPKLVNPWGIAYSHFGPTWVANQGSGVATIYRGDGDPRSLVVQIPSASESTGGHPTGVVFNGSSEFVINSNGASTGGNSTNDNSNGSSGGNSASSRFIFATEEGVIAAWAPSVDPTHAIRVISNSTSNGSNGSNGASLNGTSSNDTTNDAAVYKGLAISANGNGSLLYAADFHNNKVDVFDGSFQRVTLTTGAFTDPNLPEGFAPYGIQTINGSIYVSYAKQDEDKQDEVTGEGLGYVSVFNPDGEFVKRFVSQGNLNAPWGMTLAPASFGEFGNHILIGNFGDGFINAYDIVTGELAGQLPGANGNAIQIDGLWALAFGNGYANQPVDTLFFSAGPNDEQDGLYGRIDRESNGQNGTNGNGQNGTGGNGQNGTNGNGQNGTNGNGQNGNNYYDDNGTSYYDDNGKNGYDDDNGRNGYDDDNKKGKKYHHYGKKRLLKSSYGK